MIKSIVYVLEDIHRAHEAPSFSQRVSDAISDMQDMRLVVEVQYQQSDEVVSVQIIGREPV
jgi:hypothetical protein